MNSLTFLLELNSNPYHTYREGVLGLSRLIVVLFPLARNGRGSSQRRLVVMQQL